ncbi:MAG: ferritin-like domain-containing protein [Dehalococcoidales bacterium]
MDKAGIIALLTEDLKDEHGAIIQYLNHAYGMGEGEIACEIEAVARDEMRHLDWLAETITELGGTVNLERGKMRMGGALVPDWMRNDVFLEEGAIAQYREHIKAIDDPKIKRLLERILADEQAHRDVFGHFTEKTAAEGSRDVTGNRQDKTVEVINRSIGHEYTVVLQYLLHSYLSTDAEGKKQLEDQAVNEMQHMGWLAEGMVSSGGKPVIEHFEVDRSTKFTDMLHADIKIEREVSEAYDRAAQEAEDPDLKKLFLRMRDNEIYHAEVFSDLLEKAEKE